MYLIVKDEDLPVLVVDTDEGVDEMRALTYRDVVNFIFPDAGPVDRPVTEVAYHTRLFRLGCNNNNTQIGLKITFTVSK